MAQRTSRTKRRSAGGKVDREDTAAPRQDGAHCAFMLQDEAPVVGYDPWTLAVQDELKKLQPEPDAVLALPGAKVHKR